MPGVLGHPLSTSTHNHHVQLIFIHWIRHRIHRPAHHCFHHSEAAQHHHMVVVVGAIPHLDQYCTHSGHHRHRGGIRRNLPVKKVPLRPGKKCSPCKGKGCNLCNQRGFIIPSKKAPKPKAPGRAIAPPKPRKPVRLKAPGRQAQDTEYSHLRVSFLLANPQCQVLHASGRCRQTSTQVHHRRGRGPYYLQVSTWMACCQACHELIETKRAWAKRMGYLVNRSAIYETPEVSPTFLPYDNS